jgi:prepilin-type processing-associated H-X9-DG protein
LLITASLLPLAAPVYAQEAPQDAADNAVDEERGARTDIVVTGSRIVRDGYTAPTPVTVATTEELTKTTPTSIPDALNKLPQFQNSLGAGRSSSNWSTIPIHGNVLNLRGLGTSTNNPKGPLRTLILFDGIRVPPTTYIGTINTDVLPQMLMQRVDVVTGGASAQWGSDAVAGVVNFVLDKNFTGIKGVAQAGIAERGDNAHHRLGAAGGFDFAGGRGHILLSAEYASKDGMLRSDREYGRQGYTFVGSTSTADGVPGSAANPYTIGRDVLITAFALNGSITGSSVANNPYIRSVFNNDGTIRPWAPGATVGTTGFASGGDGYDIPRDNYAILPSRTYQTFGRISYELVDDVTAYVQGGWSRADLNYTTMQNAAVPPSQSATIFKGNPYLLPELDASLPTANDYLIVGHGSNGNPRPRAEERNDSWMVTGGFNASFGALNASLSYTHGRSTNKMATSGLYQNNRYYAALDAVIDPNNGQITCRVLLDPALASQYAGCRPLNVMSGNPAAATPDGYAYATGTSRYRAVLEHDSIAADLSGSLFELPAGPVDFAVGVEWRKQSLNLVSNSDPATLSGATPAETAAIRAAYFNGLRGVPAGASHYWIINVGTAKGSVNVKEAYGEIAVPLLRDTPFFRELSVNAAGRITDYSSSGQVETWKVGATWRPVEDLLLRATYSRDIRAPNLFELYAGLQTTIGIVNDLQIVQNGTPIYGSGQNVNVNGVSGGNPNLKPERAKTLTIGGVFTPSFLPGFSFSLDYYRIKVDGLIDSLVAQQLLTNCYNAGGSGVPECDLIERATPTSFPSVVRTLPANIAFLKTAGFDIDATYRTIVGDSGALGIRLYANYLDRFDAQQYTGAPVAHFAGVSLVGSNPAGYPRWRGNLSIDYANGPFGVTLTEQYIGKMRLDIPGGPVPIAFVDGHVSPVFYTDLALRFKVPARGGEFELFGTINNLFDKQPPIIPGTVPGVNLPTNIAVYDIVGRAFTAGVRFKF